MTVTIAEKRAQGRAAQARKRDKALTLLGLLPAQGHRPRPGTGARPGPGHGQDAQAQDQGGADQGAGGADQGAGQRVDRFGIGPGDTINILQDLVRNDLTTPHARAAAARTLAEIGGLIGRHAIAPSRGATADVADLDRADLVRELERLRARVAAQGADKGTD